jgi:hypothetical protein
MKRLLIAAGMVLALVAVPASAKSVRNCGGATTVTGTSCKVARGVVKRLDTACQRTRGGTCRVKGFACLTRTARHHRSAVRCTKGTAVIVRRLGVGAMGPNGLSSCKLVLMDDTGMNVFHLGRKPAPINGTGTPDTVGDVSSNLECRVGFDHQASTPTVNGTIRMRIANPVIGSNEYSCTATGSFRCFGPRDGSNLRGWDLRVLYYVCIPGEDVKTLGRHLPGYCGTP